jgi:two-component system KDP operon response regulator KdpE
MSHGRILIVDDDPQIRRVMRTTLVVQGYAVDDARSGEDAIESLRNGKHDLVLLDMNMPGLSGLETCRAIRAGSDIAIVMLTVRDSEKDKIAALDAGADDYITKPFGVGELLARVRVALRHAARGASARQILELADGEVDLAARTASRNGHPVHLTPLEFRLLARLARSLGMVVTHRDLLTEVWGPTHAEHTHYLRIYMKQLRDKLERDPLRPQHFLTETGVGYRFVAAERTT